MKRSNSNLKLLLAPLSLGIFLWVFDAVIDSMVFKRGGFLDELILGISPHEFYFRSFYLVFLVLAGYFVMLFFNRRRIAEDQLRKFELAVVNSPATVLITDSYGKIEYTNPKFSQVTGYTADEAVGRSPRILKSGLTPIEVYADLWETITQGREWRGEFVNRKKNGDIYWELASISPVRDKAGQIRHFIAVKEDITARKLAEEALRKSEKRLRAITSSLGEGVYVLDANGCLTFMNPEAERLLGWTERDLLGRHIHDTIHRHRPDGSVLTETDCPIRSVVESGRKYASDCNVFMRRDGSEFPVSLVSTPIIDEGAVVATVTVFRDLTVTKKMQEEMQRVRELESLGILAGGIAHDFNNLLTGVLGCISIARDQLAPEAEPYEALTMALSAARQAKDLTFRLLTFSKSGTCSREQSSIGELLRETVSFVLRGSAVKYELSIDEDLWNVEIDRTQINQVFHNLAINAREAMPEGGTLSLQARNCGVTPADGLPLSEGDYVRISFADQGVGIAEENLGRVFDPYYTTKPLGTQRGVGLGLAICFSIMKSHSGHITAESKKGSGTTFTLYLPSVAGNVITMPETLHEAPPSLKRILIMDDEELVGRVAAMLFKRMGLEATVVTDGNDALAAYRKARDTGRPFELVIMDLTIPGGKGGKDTIVRLLEMDPEAVAVVSSGYSEDAVMTDYSAYGFKDALFKPYEKRNVEDLLRHLTEKGLLKT